MVEFNPDGSIKLPQFMVEKKKQQEIKMRSSKCMLVRKSILNFSSPKKCMLVIKLSDAVTDSRFMGAIYGEFHSNSEVPSRITQVNEKEFEIEIGTHFRRCTECSRLIAEYREFLQVIEENGNCSFSPNGNFCYEDYFE